MAEFECRLKLFRQEKGLTQEQLAQMVGVRRETIMRLEKALYNPSLRLAVDISRAVGARSRRSSFLIERLEESFGTQKTGSSKNCLFF